MRDVREDRGWPVYYRPMLVLGLGVAAIAIGYGVGKSLTQNPVGMRDADDAPQRTLRRKSRDETVVGRTITINRPRAELFAFWADFSNLPQFMQNLQSVSLDGDVAHWQIKLPGHRSLAVQTRMTDRVENEVLAWTSTEDSELQASGRVVFRDAPAGRGTEVEGELSYVAPFGELGKLIGRFFQTDPLMQGRRELRRFKMLMETGEIATSKNHKTDEQEA
ncbi:MAG: SRPBCC family protein [Candidatus Saccharibacteria bacterium]|nr:SRPBCC family protein [Pseudorhodobacter sp.]